MARDPIPTWFFVLVVVRRGAEFLVVRETKHGQLWYLPAGRVEPGETLLEAARRETLEESGVPIEIEGILRLEHTPTRGATRVRVVFVARPADDTPPKKTPDEHSREAGWVRLDELDRLPLRGPDVRWLFEAVAGGAPIAPLSLLGREGDE
jgi:phosphatase NudJ